MHAQSFELHVCELVMPGTLPAILLSAILTITDGNKQSDCLDCLKSNNERGLPDYRSMNSDLNSGVISYRHQAIVHSYRFDCHGNITEWGVAIDGGGMVSAIDLQVWRPSPTVAVTGCYSLVGNNRFTSVTLRSQVAEVTPLPQERIQFQPGDVLGFYVESALSQGDAGGGVVVANDLSERGDRGYETEEVWYADITNAVISNLNCPYLVGPGRQLNTFTNAAPVITATYTSKWLKSVSQNF